jgi:hypothetical protein
MSAVTSGTGLRVLEVAWYIHPARVPRNAGPLLDLIERVYPPAWPVRFGAGDPLPWTIEREGLERFEQEWARRATEGVGGALSWQGRRPHLHASMAFPHSKLEGDSTAEIADLRWMLDGSSIAHEPEGIAAAFASMGQDLGAVYGCAYVLDGWSLRGSVLSSNVHTSDASPLPGGSRWIGIPPGSPWLAWYGSEYRSLLGPLLDPSGTRVGNGILSRRSNRPSRQDEPGLDVPLPDEVLARRRDPRFPGVLPSVPAVVIPRLDPGDSTLSALS